jgi:uncharacterized membrane protein YfcA
VIAEIGHSLKLLAPFRGFFLTLISIVGLIALAFYKDIDITMALPAVLGLYLGAKTSEKASAHFAASRDPSCNTAEVIAAVTEK